MDLGVYVEGLQRQVAVAAEAGGEEARAVAERLTVPLEAAIRLTLQDALDRGGRGDHLRPGPRFGRDRASGDATWSSP